MKNKIATLIALVLTSTFTFAQTSVGGAMNKAGNAAKTATSMTGGMGNLLSQFGKGIKGNAFTDTFKSGMGDWSKKAGSATGAAGWAGSLLGLQGGLKESAMTAGWQTVKGQWIKDAKTANTVAQVAGLLGQLESNIDSKYFTGKWGKQRSTWQAALKALAQ